MYRLAPCITILGKGQGGRGWGWVIKSVKKMCICECVIFSIDTF